MPRQAQREQKQQSRQNVWTEALAKMLYKDAVEDKYEGTGTLFTDANWANIVGVKFEDGLLHITVSIDSVLRDEKSWTRVLTLKPVGWEKA